MIRIVSDTSTMYSRQQAQQAGFDVSALSVTIAGSTYREFDEIDAEQFVSIIKQGHMPTSSQPAVGEVAALYEQYPEDEIVNITMAHGLSGTYNGAMAAAELGENPERITVINSRTLCGPHRYLVENAVRMVQEGKSKQEIVEKTEQLMDTAKSYLMPADFGYLRRGGRLSPLVAHVGQTIHFVPIMTQSDDGTQLTLAGVRRSLTQAARHIAKALESRGVGEGWRIYISHGAAPELAEQVRVVLEQALPNVHLEIHPLTPAFITQGGPSCVAVQVIHE